MLLSGSMVALVTPMRDEGDIDFDSLSTLIEWHIRSGTQAIVILGTTGEAPTITDGEREQLIRYTVERVGGRVLVIVGTGTHSTADTIKKTRQAASLGADACLIVTPYYNKPTQEGLYQHYRAVSEAVATPQILYNVPGRTACDLAPKTVARLAVLPNIKGIKEATPSMARLKDIQSYCGGNSLALLSGDDATAKQFMLAGGHGVISVTANVAPKLMRDMIDSCVENDLDTANALDEKLSGLHKALFVESNPIPVKWALHEMDKMPGGIRLPLTPLSSDYYEQVRLAMAQADIDQKEVHYE